ncbi:DNA-directed RNA polymerase subunit beta', partial [Nitrospinae bacterium AH_259_B05_G02_I21]|nr:DNA-directed RNA polymerase subunit beta' [Nitrospinae bacterium AH_259_B05_G02_I21]
DFDGDQMAVHVPLSIEAQVEARVLMLSSNNILSPAHGKPLAVPSQDMIMGCYYLTKQRGDSKGEDRVFSSKQEVLVAHDHDEVDLQTRIRVRVDGEIITTTVGRVVFCQIVPDAIPFALVNQPMGKRELTDLVNQSYLMAGKE